MDKRYTDSEYLFKNFLLSKLNLKATYLDIPDNNCFYLCISEVIKNLSLNIEKKSVGSFAVHYENSVEMSCTVKLGFCNF